ncbi:angiopoietin-4 [Ictidomys tridecemlineatus]
MLSRAAMLLGGLLLAVATMIAAQRSGPEAAAQCQVHLVQSGPCSYTFVLPDPQLCPLGDPGSPDSLQRDVSPTAPSASLGAWRAQRMRQLEKALENSTLRLQKVSVATCDLGDLRTRGRSVTPGPSLGRDWMGLRLPPWDSSCSPVPQVFCGMESNGGGWTIIQRRVDGSEDFQRSWKEYKEGFGNPAGEYWLGNEAIHQLTSRATYSLRVELEDWEDQEAYAQYERFQLGSEAQLYRISVSGYSDSVGRQTGLFLRSANFSTRDADNDNCVCECAQLLSGGWWFDACGLSNLNGVYYRDGQHLRRMDGVRWQYFRGPGYSLRATRMMIRPVGG